MARYGPADAAVSLAGSNVPDVTVIGSLDKEAVLEEVTPVASAYQTNAYVGVKKLGPVTFEAPYSTTSGDLAVVGDTAGVGATLAVIVTIGGAKTVSFSSIVQKIQRQIARGAFTKYILTVQPTSTITEA